MCSDCANLKELMLLWQREHERSHDRSREAVDKALSALNERLAEMNQLRSQLDRERGSYINRGAYDQDIKQTDDRIKVLETRGSFDAGRMVVLGGIAGVVLTLIGFAIKFWKG